MHVKEAEIVMSAVDPKQYPDTGFQRGQVVVHQQADQSQSISADIQQTGKDPDFELLSDQ
jgi:hypothetical protein